MSNVFSNLTNEGFEEQKDSLGGFQLFDSNTYPARIKVAYAGRSQSGAMSVTIHADIEGKEYRETVYITNREGKNFYMSKDNKKNPLPGFTLINDLCKICTGKPLSQMETENKVLNIYSAELQKETPTQVPIIMGLLDKPVTLGILKEKRFKQVSTANGYVDSDEIRESNVINKIFDPETGQTAYEIAHEIVDSPLFIDKWLNKNKDIVVDKTKGKTPQVTGGNKSSAQQAPRKSLFN